MGNGLEIKGYKLEIEALDFGLYGRFLYFISEKGNIRLNRLMESLDNYFNAVDFGEKELSAILKYKHPVNVAELNDFPVDSIVFDYKLLIATAETVKIIPVNLSKIRSDSISSINLNNVISFARSGSLLFASQDKEGLSIFNPPFEWVAHLNIPSIRIETGGNSFINIYPDFSPKVFSILSRRKRVPEEKFKLVMQTPSSLVFEDVKANKIFSNEKITGRDILYPEIDKDEVRLYLYNGEKCSANISRQEFDRDISVKLPTLIASESVEYLRKDNTRQIKSSQKRVFPIQVIANNNIDFPIDFFPFKDGYIVQYWSHVDYLDIAGCSHRLVEGSEIARVRTYPPYSAYTSYITIATEDACWIFRIRNLSSSPSISKSSSRSSFKKITVQHTRGITE
ncbi:MAG: hypothetical protein K2J48_04030 [Muribaculaceae bacterium]|nr:hypothetical protein [Muribaculaceae bacterium]